MKLLVEPGEQGGRGDNDGSSASPQLFPSDHLALNVSEFAIVSVDASVDRVEPMQDIGVPILVVLAQVLNVLPQKREHSGGSLIGHGAGDGRF